MSSPISMSSSTTTMKFRTGVSLTSRMGSCGPVWRSASRRNGRLLHFVAVRHCRDTARLLGAQSFQTSSSVLALLELSLTLVQRRKDHAAAVRTDWCGPRMSDRPPTHWRYCPVCCCHTHSQQRKGCALASASRARHVAWDRDSPLGSPHSRLVARPPLVCWLSRCAPGLFLRSGSRLCSGTASLLWPTLARWARRAAVASPLPCPRCSLLSPSAGAAGTCLDPRRQQYRLMRVATGVIVNVLHRIW